jgi:DNA-binding beta-propeller fold protein YncE
MPVERRRGSFGLVALLIGFIVLITGARSAFAAGQYLVGDRTLGRVLRYAEDGAFLGTLLNDPSLGSGLGSNDGGITGLTLSPDQTRLYVSDRLSNRVAVYSYSGTSASHLFDITAVTAAPSTLFVPAGVLFSQDASKIYVANLGPFAPLPVGDRVAQLTPNGASAGPDLSGGPMQGRSGLAITPSGDLLASNFALFGNGGVLRFNTASNQFEPFVTDRPELRGAANLLVVGDDLYVAAGGGGRVGKFDANTGALDTTFAMSGYIGPDVNFGFPASLALGPGGNSILVGVLGSTTGDSRIEEFDFSGNSLGVWATNTHSTNFPPNGMGTVPSNNIMGFSEPTGIVFSTFIPEPSSAVLAMMSLAWAGATGRRHARRRNRRA